MKLSLAAVSGVLAAAAALPLAVGPSRAETDPAHFNAHLSILAHGAPASGGPAPSSRSKATEPQPQPQPSPRSLGYEAGKRGSVHGLIARHAAVHGVPVALADAVVRIESRYNPSARNAGAVGLMQIKPQTARGLGYNGGAAGLMNPETNVRYGMMYLAQAYRMSGGDTCTTLMRYQSGHYARRANAANRAYCAKARTIMASN